VSSVAGSPLEGAVGMGESTGRKLDSTSFRCCLTAASETLSSGATVWSIGATSRKLLSKPMPRRGCCDVRVGESFVAGAITVCEEALVMGEVPRIAVEGRDIEPPGVSVESAMLHSGQYE
jgi:hypothetical protein